MKTIVITISPGQGVRNILRATDILKILKSSNRIVILTPLFNDKSFIAEFGGKNVAFENLARCKLNIMERVLKKIAEIIFFNVNYVETIKLKEIKLRKKNYPKYLGLKLVKKILGKNKNLIKALENLDMLLFRYKCKKCGVVQINTSAQTFSPPPPPDGGPFMD